MPTLLRLDSSADLDHSRSRALTDAFVDAWTAAGADRQVVVRDLHREPLPHLQTPAQHWPEAMRDGAFVPSELEDIQREVIGELLAADVVVIGAPMYNYSMPATLKNWVDLIHVPGLTAPFPGHETQPLAGRSAVIVTAQGATYDAGSPTEGDDHVTPPLRLVLGTNLGMHVHVVATSRTLVDRLPALGADQAQAEYAAAEARLRELGAAV
ncbi:MAG: FMN-dependent NADH-azoreductase [Microbacterium sp.]